MAAAAPTPAEQAVVRHAIDKGYLSAQQLRQALLLREQLKADQQPSELLPILGARFVRPEHLDDLRRVWQRSQGDSSGGGIAQIPDQLLRASGEIMLRPATQDPEPVKKLLEETLSGAPANSAFGKPIPATIDPDGPAPAANSAFGKPIPSTIDPDGPPPAANSAFGKPIPATIDPDGPPSGSAFGVPSTIDPDQQTVLDRNPLRGDSNFVAPPGSGSAFGAPPSSSGSAFGAPPPGSAFGSNPGTSPGARPASTGFGPPSGPFGSGAGPGPAGPGPFGSGAGPFGSGAGPAGSGAGPFGSAPRGGPGGTSFGPPASGFGSGPSGSAFGAGPSGSAFGAPAGAPPYPPPPSGSAWGRPGPTGTAPGGRSGPSESAWGRPGPTGTAPGGGSGSAFGQPPPPAFGPHGTAFGPPSAPGGTPVSTGFGSSPAGSAFGAPAAQKKVVLPEPAPVPGTIDDVGDSTPAARAEPDDDDDDQEERARPRRRGRSTPPPAGGIGTPQFVLALAGAFLVPVGIMIFLLSSASSERQERVADARRETRSLLESLSQEGTPGERAQRALVFIAKAQLWRDRDAEDPNATTSLVQGYLALAQARIAAQRWEDADWALAQAKSLESDADKVSKVQEERDVAEAAASKAKRDALVALLEVVDDLQPRTPEEADELARQLAELASPETTPLLLERLDQVTATLRAAETRVYREAEEAFETEPAAKLPKLEKELEALATRTLVGKPPRPGADMTQAINRLLKREKKLADRAERPPALRMEQLVARRQRQKLGHGGVVARILCGALGRGEPSEEVLGSLNRFLANCSDPLAAVPAGIALARLEDNEQARELLMLALTRFGPESPFTMQLARFAATDHAAGKGPSDATGLQQLGLFLRARGQAPKALGYYQRALLQQKRNPQLLGQWAEAQVSLKNYTKTVLDRANNALTIDPKCVIALYARGSIKTHQHDDEAAVKDLQTAVAEDAWNPVLLSRLGLARLEADDLDGALRDFERAIGLDPEWPEGWLGRAKARLERRDFEGAAADASQALRLGEREAFLVRGKARQGARYLLGAIADLTHALVYESRDPRLYAARGRVRLAMKDPEEALKDFLEALKIAPNVPEYIDGKARCYELKLQDRKAIAEYTKAIEREKHSALLWGARGRLYLNQGVFDRALEDLNKALEIAPKDAVYYRHRGLTYMLKGYTQEAVLDLEKAIELDPDHPEGYKFLGDLRNVQANISPVEARQGHLDSAMENYTRSIELDPYNPQTWESRGTLRLRMKDIPQALQDLDQAVKVDPTYHQAYLSRGNIRMAEQNYTAAIADFSMAITVNAKFADAYFFRAMAKNRAKQEDWRKDLAKFLNMASKKHPRYKKALSIMRASQRRKKP